MHRPYNLCAFSSLPFYAKSAGGRNQNASFVVKLYGKLTQKNFDEMSGVEASRKCERHWFPVTINVDHFSMCVQSASEWFILKFFSVLFASDIGAGG